MAMWSPSSRDGEKRPQGDDDEHVHRTKAKTKKTSIRRGEEKGEEEETQGVGDKRSCIDNITMKP